MKHWSSYFMLACSTIAGDRITKYMALSYCAHEQPITSWLSCETVFNRGVSWSLFAEASERANFLLIIGIIALIFVLGWHSWNKWNNNKSIVGEVLVLAGAFSNLYDRFVYGSVIDFIVLHYHTWSWPVFNIADTAIVFGILIMAWYEYNL